ncbi:sugar kinase [Olivibacter sitiensis]|uniref:sugar kinase n=1 Tax=Olivibacter sitiensis TaxID=376470 RepID=UPI0003FB344F|nr:sugar kinase [Olivibacter sitiensis]
MQATANDSIAVFGELLLRASSQSTDWINRPNAVSFYTGGSEANVAATLGQLSLPCKYISSIPDNQLAQEALHHLERLGVDTSATTIQGDRLGLYFLLSANGLSKGEVVYDRKYSSFYQMKPGTINWEEKLKGCTWFHWTAISPALSADIAMVCLEALQAAKKLGLTISVDLNYRNRLWNYGKAAHEVMPELVSYCDVVMGNIWASNVMLGTDIDASLHRHTEQEVYIAHANATARELLARFDHCKHIAFTYRFMDSPQHNLLYGTYHTAEGNYVSAIHETQHVVDRIGSGDAFMGGLIYALVNQMEPQRVIEVATSAGFNKLFVVGDFGDGKI